MLRKTVVALAACITALAGSQAFAQQGFYLGAGLGATFGEVADVPVSGAIVTSRTKDEEDIGFKVLAGYQFNRYFAVEGGYIDFGKFGTTVNTIGGQATIEVKADGWFADLVGILPLTNNFSLFGKLGVLWGTNETTASSSGGLTVTGTGKNDDLSGLLGIGVQFDITRNFALRGEYEFYSEVGGTNGGDTSYLGVGLLLKF